MGFIPHKSGAESALEHTNTQIIKSGKISPCGDGVTLEVNTPILKLSSKALNFLSGGY